MLYHNRPSFIVAFRSLKLIQVAIEVNMKTLILNNKALVSVIVVFIKLLAKKLS